MRYFILTLLSFYTSIIVGQEHSKLHLEGKEKYKARSFQEAEISYEKALEQYIAAKDTYNRIICLSDLASAKMHQWKSDQALSVYEQASALAEESGNNKLYSEILSARVVIIMYTDRREEAEKLCHKILSLPDVDPYLESNAYVHLATIKKSEFQYDSSKYYNHLAVTIDSITQDSSSLPFSCLDLATLYYETGDSETALEYMFFGESYLRPGVDDFKKASFFDRFSNIFYSMGNLSKAMSYANDNLIQCEKSNLTIGKAIAYSNLADIETAYENYEKAIELYEKADSINQKSKKKLLEGIILLGKLKAQLLSESSIDDKDLLRLNKVKASIEDKRLQLQLDLLEFAVKSQDFDTRAFENKYTQLENEIESNQSLLHRRFLEHIGIMYYENNNNWAKAYELQVKLNKTKNLISNKNQEYIVHDLEAQYQKELKDKEIESLSQDNKSKAKILSAQRLALFLGGLGLVMVSLLSFLLFRLYRQVFNQRGIIAESLEEKETLLKEIHHRVKNNLQVISSLLRIQSKQTNDPGALGALKEGQSRVQSMSLIHQNLYEDGNTSIIEMKTYLTSLSTQLFDTYNISKDNINLVTSIDDIELDIDTVVPLGLITNELITNSLKYAFPEGSKGTVTMSLKKVGQKVSLCVEDDGVGFSQEELKSNRRFGQGLIAAFVNKLDAEYQIGSIDGTKVTITFIPNLLP